MMKLVNFRRVGHFRRVRFYCTTEEEVELLNEEQKGNKTTKITINNNNLIVNVNILNFTQRLNTEVTKANFEEQFFEMCGEMDLSTIHIDTIVTSGANLRGKELQQLRMPENKFTDYRFKDIKDDLSIKINDSKELNGIDIAINMYKRKADIFSRDAKNHLLAGAFTTRKENICFFHQMYKHPFFIERDFKENQLLIAEKGGKAFPLSYWNFDKSLISSIYFGNVKTDGTSALLYNKGLQLLEANEEGGNKEIDFPLHYWRLELKLRNKPEVIAMYNAWGGNSEEFRRLLVKEKNKLVRFVKINPHLSLANKKKSRATATFWADLERIFLDKERSIVVDRGESFKDLKIYKEIEKNLSNKELEGVKRGLIEG